MSERNRERKPSRFEIICTVLVRVIFGGIVLLLAVLSALVTCTVYGGDEIVEYMRDWPVFHMTALGGVLGFGAYHLRVREGRKRAADNNEGRIKRSKFVQSLLVLAGVLGIWLLLTGFWPISDQRMSFESAQALLRGDFSPWSPVGFLYKSPLEPTGYAYTYPSQNGLILYFALIATLFRGFTPYVLQVMNIFFLIGGLWFLCRLMGKTALLKNPERLTLAMIGFLPFAFYFTFVYGTIPGFYFSCGAMYFGIQFLELDKGGWRDFLKSAFCAVAAVLLKPNYLIALVALVLFLAAGGVFQRKAKYLAAAALLLMIYLAAGRGMNWFLEKTTSYPAGKGAPMLAWVEMGLQDSNRGAGWYNGYNVRVFSENELDPERTAKAVKRDLRNTLEEWKADPAYAVDFLKRKVESIWAEPTFQSLWIQQVKGDCWLFPGLTESLFEEKGALNLLYLTVTNLLQTLVYAGAFLYALLYRKGEHWLQLMPAVLFIGGFLFHLGWEAKSQYSVCYFILLFPYAVLGLEEAAARINALWTAKSPVTKN